MGHLLDTTVSMLSVMATLGVLRDVGFVYTNVSGEMVLTEQGICLLTGGYLQPLITREAALVMNVEDIETVIEELELPEATRDQITDWMQEHSSKVIDSLTETFWESLGIALREYPIK